MEILIWKHTDIRSWKVFPCISVSARFITPCNKFRLEKRVVNGFLFLSVEHEVTLRY